MNANSIWSGNDYAYLANRGRGQSFGWSAERVRAIRVYPKYGYAAERATSMVECVVCTDDGEIKKSVAGTELIRDVRARDIISRWEDYEAERNYRKEQREKIERERQEKQAKEEQEKSRILEALETKGIERSAVSTITDYGVTINRHVLESWLGLEVNDES
jgi:hypothetical protein